MMRFPIRAARAASLLAACLACYSQAGHAQTSRAQVRAELVRIEQAGFDPLREPLEFPADIQAAEARLAAGGATALAATPALPALANAAGGHASTTPRVTSVASATHDGGVENGDAPALSH
ncbi:DUF4148 domain-containing protein [Burkholderia gladioli]|uniref:DUF4148 domain-containing protein n=2 Tax=Burkholderia gladioli TaxID=28095 RepID=UPI001FC7FEED|nr:DUF4148 domain-containing protein [Burkholderia gladioli]